MNLEFFHRFQTLKFFRSSQTGLWLMLLPYALGTLVLVIIPALATAAVAFTRYNGIAGPQWVGVAQFIRLSELAYVRTALGNTLVFVLLAIPLRVLGALGLALLLQHQRPLFGVYRTAVYLPTIIPPVAYALIGLWLFNPVYGPLNGLLALVGLPQPPWLAEPGWAQLAIVLMLAIQLGEGFIILLAGLRNIGVEVLEAANIDGAGRLAMFRYVIGPLLLPWVILLTLRDLIVAVQGTFTPSFVMTYGGPYFSTTFLPLLVYELAFDYLDFGLTAALLLAGYLLLALIVWGFVQILRHGGIFDDL